MLDIKVEFDHIFYTGFAWKMAELDIDDDLIDGQNLFWLINRLNLLLTDILPQAQNKNRNSVKFFCLFYFIFDLDQWVIHLIKVKIAIN